MTGRRPLLERLMARVVTEDRGYETLCWVWQGSVMNSGYGHIRPGGRAPMVGAHRAAYEVVVGPIPEGLDLDHLCRVRLCCNPDHLEPVTRQENLLRGAGSKPKTQCSAGHSFDEVNTYVDRRGRRACRECRRDRDRLRRAA